jgi:aryl-alcohol dehydrogenase-like predicted oxidoreductase
VTRPSIPPLTPPSTRRLGGSDLEVSPIGLGVMQMARRGFVERVYHADMDQAGANAIVKAALGAGITMVDTAEMYGDADHVLAAALREAGAEKVTLATKWNPMLRRAARIARGPDLRLQATHLPILHQIHWPYGSLSSRRKQLQAMARLYHADVIKAVGVSNFTAAQMRQAHDILADEGVPLATNQVRVSLLCRDIETNGVLAAARELGVTLIGYFPLASGLLTGKFHDHPDLVWTASRQRRLGNRITRRTLERTTPLIRELTAIGDRHHRRPAQVALAWLITYYDNLIAIPGASQPYHAADNATAMQLHLSPDELAVLDELSWSCAPRGKATSAA